MTTSINIVQDGSVASVLIHPLRARMLGMLKEPGSATTLAAAIGLPRQQVNYHLREMEGAGLVELHSERKKRNCTERLFQATAKAFVLAPSVLGGISVDPDSLQNRLSPDYLVAVGARMIGEVSSLRSSEDSFPTFALESEVAFSDDEARFAFAQELSRSFDELVERYNRPGSGRGFRFAATLHPIPLDN